MNERTFWRLGAGILAASALVIYGPAIARAAAPFVRKGVKSAVKAIEQGREVAAELYETAEDAFAEARYELRAEAERAQPDVKQNGTAATAARDENAGEPNIAAS